MRRSSFKCRSNYVITLENYTVGFKAAYSLFRMSAYTIKDTKVMLRRSRIQVTPDALQDLDYYMFGNSFRIQHRRSRDALLTSRMYRGCQRQRCNSDKRAMCMNYISRHDGGTLLMAMRHLSSVKYFRHECPKYANIIQKDNVRL